MQDRRTEGPPLLLRLPALRRLRLLFLFVPSLGLLQHSPLLEELRLRDCREMSAAVVMSSLRAHPPRLLRVLELIICVELSEEQQSLLRPPSALLPALRSCMASAQR